MGSLTRKEDIFTRIAQGYGVHQCLSGTGASTTAGGSTSGNFSCKFIVNSTGTTFPSTIKGFLYPAVTGKLRLVYCHQAMSVTTSSYLAICYKIGTVVLTSTGDQFTHDSATFPVLRTQFGVASQPVNLIPMIQVTTATSSTAPAFTLSTSGGGAGYVNHAGSNIVGAKTFTFPAAATVTSSTFVLRLERGDIGVRDVSAVNVTTSSSTGAAVIWGVELLAVCNSPTNNANGICNDLLFGSLSLPDILPATATSGTATSFLSVVQFAGSTGGISQEMTYMAVLDT
jgi:hypothetical protein